VIHARRLVVGKDFADAEVIDVPELPSGVYSLSWAADAHIAAISVTGPQIAGDIWTWNADTGEVNRVTHSATGGLDMDSMIVPQPCQFVARDDVTLHGLLYIPRNTSPSAKPPVLLSVHGGPTAQARPQFNAIHQYLLTRGIAIFDLNYRGSTGYGKSYARLNDRLLRANEYLDMADAVEWLRSQGTVDASRAAVMGGSYGGYLTMAALTRLADQFDAGVAFVGVSNWLTAMEGAAPVLKASDRVEFGDIDNPEDREFFRSISPIGYVDNIRAPMMILHGANDPRDPVKESDEFVRAIRDRNGQVDYLRFPDEGHGIRKLSNQIIAYRRIAQFLEATLVPARNP
jgi:dipeptidyl aminopeptidase/acylaminoacyl peptidase